MTVASEMLSSLPIRRLESPRAAKTSTSVSLSERETEIVVLAARGLSNRMIGQQLDIAEATAKRHLANVYQKIGVNSRSEAVRMALMEQWIGLGEITSSADGDGSGTHHRARG